MKNTLILVIVLLFSTGVFGEDVTVNVMEGDSVTLHTGTDIQIDDVIKWSFGQDIIATVNRGSIEDISVSVNLDERFEDRLQANNQTGDLKISNIRVTDSGEYKLQNSRNKSLTKTFRLNVMPPGVSMMLVLEGQTVTLPTGVPEVQREDVVSWTFNDQKTLIAKMHKAAGIFSKYDGPDRMFVDKLELDYLAGSLTIRNAGNRHSGLYEVDLSSSKHTIHKSFNVTFSGEKRTVSEMKGESLTLHTGITEIESYDFTSWRFGDTVIAEIYQSQPSQPPNFFKYNGPDGRFRDRLNLDKTGSLTIKNTRITDSGEYELKIMKSRQTIFKRFTVTVSDSSLPPGAVAGITIVGVIAVIAFIAVIAAFVLFHRQKTLLKRTTQEIKSLSVKEKEDARLETGVTKVKEPDVILWMFGDQKRCTIAHMTGCVNEVFTYDDVLEGKFSGRLKLDQTGSLTIENTTITDTGLYQLMMMIDKHLSVVLITVNVLANTGNVPEEMHMLQDGETDGIIIQDK